MRVGFALQEAEDGSVCFNGCSGHGECVDYSCHCFNGFHGDDCSVTFADERNIIPIMSAGDFNLTKKNFTSTVSRHKFILVGFSSYSCLKCIQVEPEYIKITEALKELKIPFARANVDKLKSLSIQHGAVEMPALVLFKKHKPLLYKGAHSLDPVMRYVQKQVDPPARELSSVKETLAFLDSRSDRSNSISTVMVVGFFSDHEVVEEDDFEEYMEVAANNQGNGDVYFGVVTDPDVADWFLINKTIDRTPSFLLVDDTGSYHAVNADEFYGENTGLDEWIKRQAVPTVGLLSNANFDLYAKIGLPMLMMFLDLTHAHATSDPGRVVGGRSGGILNEMLLEEYRHAAKDHIGRLVFVYLDGTKHEDQMRSVGLYGGAARLPSIAFNTRDGSKIPFPEELPINRDTILQFCADFISGKLKSEADAKEMARKALQSARPLNTKNTATRKARKKAPEQVRGVSEQFGDGAAGDTDVVVVTSKNFMDIAMDDSKDVLLMFHSTSCESCAHFSVYYKRMAQRFADLKIESLVVARMDVSNDAPPPHLNLLVHDLPLLVFLPSDDKTPPWNYYSGVGKVQTMMKWAQKFASIPFDLPNLPHLKESDRELYKTQVREREEYLESKRLKDEEEMRQEEERRQELLSQSSVDREVSEVDGEL